MVVSPDAAREMSPFVQAALRGTPVNRLCRVIDVHGHLGHPGLFDCAVTDAAGVLAVMDRVGIDVLCTSHLHAILSNVSRGNDMMAEAVRTHPSRFIGYAVVNPNRPADEIDAELERCFTHLGMRGIKTHIGFHDYPADGPAYQRVYEFADDHQLPLLAHSLGAAPVAARIARDHPRAKLIIAHLGGGFHGRLPDDVVALAGEYDNVYVDLAFSLSYFGGLESLVRYVPVEKILFASDICFQQATHQIGAVLMADISDEDKRKILGENAAKVFGVS